MSMHFAYFLSIWTFRAKKKERLFAALAVIFQLWKQIDDSNLFFLPCNSWTSLLDEGIFLLPLPKARISFNAIDDVTLRRRMRTQVHFDWSGSLEYFYLDHVGSRDRIRRTGNSLLRVFIIVLYSVSLFLPVYGPKRVSAVLIRVWKTLDTAKYIFLYLKGQVDFPRTLCFYKNLNALAMLTVLFHVDSERPSWHDDKVGRGLNRSTFEKKNRMSCKFPEFRNRSEIGFNQNMSFTAHSKSHRTQLNLEIAESTFRKEQQRHSSNKN